jgi:hypothetical protein
MHTSLPKNDSMRQLKVVMAVGEGYEFQLDKPQRVGLFLFLIFTNENVPNLRSI